MAAPMAARRLPVPRQTLLDRVIARFDPVRAAERVAARAELAAWDRSGSVSGFGGVWNGARRDRRQTSDWATRGGSANADTSPDLPALRERSRDLMRNSPLAVGAKKTAVTNVVGTGLMPRPEIDRDFLGIDDDVAEAFEAEAARLFRLWCERDRCDISRHSWFGALQRLAYGSVLDNGDTLAVERYIERPGDPFGLRVQLVEGDRLSNPKRGPDRANYAPGVDLVGGVEVEQATGAPIAYNVTRRHPGDAYAGASLLEWDRVPAFGPSGRRLVHHLFIRERVDQARGVPFLSVVIESLKQLTDYGEAEIMAAVMNACFAIAFKTPTGDGSLGMETEAPTDGASSSATGAAREEIKVTRPGMIVDLDDNEAIQSFTPGRPSPQFEPFTKAVLRYIGVALGIPFEVLIGHFEASYSASRASLEMLWQFVLEGRDWLVSSFCAPLYASFIAECVAKRYLSAPGFFDDPMIAAAYCRAAWVGRPKPQLDPLKEATANKVNVENGFTSIDAVCMQTTGGGFQATHRQRVREHDARAKGGLEPAIMGASVRLAGDAPTDAPPDQADQADQADEADDTNDGGDA